MDSNITMDAIVTFLGQMGASTSSEASALCKAAVSIIFPILEERSRTPEEDLDILHDYRLQAKQYSALQRKHVVAGKPIFKDGVWHCPDCNGRTSPSHSFCHRCGKKLGWR